MTGRSVRAGTIAAAAVAAFYATAIIGASGLDHLGNQASADWPYLTAIMALFGTQVALLGMIACSAHHLADLLPIVGVSAAAGFLAAWRTEFMLAGIAVNLIGVAVAARRLQATNGPPIARGTTWRAA